jgi:hypothetical protein
MERYLMFKVPEEDRKIFLEYLAKKPYIEVAGLVARIAAWTKIESKEKNGKDKARY